MFFEDTKRFPPPTSRKFERRVWQEAGESDAEKRVAQLALHVDAIHSDIRRNAEETYRMFPADAEARASVLLSLFNFVFSELLVAAGKGKGGGDVVSVGELMTQRLSGVQTTASVTPDEAITGFVDSIRFPIFDLLSGDDSRFKGEEGDLLDAVRFHAHAAQLYHAWRDVWQEVELRQLRPDEEKCLRYEEPELAWTAVLAAHRADRNALNNVLASQHVWTRTSRNFKKAYADPDVRLSGNNVRFRPTSTVPTDMPYQFLLRNQLVVEVSRQALGTMLPGYGGISIGEIVRCWEVLSLVATALCREIQDQIECDHGGGEVSPSSCFFLFNRLELIKDLSRYSGISEGRVSNAVRAMTYAPDAVKSLWGRPLVDAGSGRLHLLLAPLVMGRLTYPLKDWVKAGGGNLSEKGFAFEEDLYRDISIALSKCGHLSGWKVFKNVTFAVENRSEEVDVLLMTDTKVIIIEAKNFLPGYEAHEVVRYLRSVKDAVKQVERKVSGIAARRAALREFCDKRKIEFQLSLDDVQIVPLVVMFGPLGVGLECWTSPVVDQTTLLRFLGNERPSFHEARYGGSFKVAGGGAVFESTEEADALIYEYMQRPPIIERYKSLIRDRPIPLFDTLDVLSDYRLSYFEVEADPEEILMSKRHVAGS